MSDNNMEDQTMEDLEGLAASALSAAPDEAAGKGGGGEANMLDNVDMEMSLEDSHMDLDLGGNSVEQAAAASLQQQQQEEQQQHANDFSVPTKEGVMEKKLRRKRRRKRHNDKLLQDCISIDIPIDYSADLGVALRHTRQKRLEALQKQYPELFQQQKAAAAPEGAEAAASDASEKEDGGEDEKEEGKEEKSENNNNDNNNTNTNTATNNNSKSNKKTNKKPNPSQVDRNNFSSIVDYLEAKYVKGVMIDDGEGDEDDEEERGSVYSESSFLDDADLQRSVAEQVLAQTTTTKMELSQDFDSEFFVNVGTLEVEETEQTKEHYDPLKDVDDKSGAAGNANKKQRKRPKPAPKKTDPSSATSAGATSKPKAPPAAPKAPPAKKESGSSPPPKKKAKVAKDDASATTPAAAAPPAAADKAKKPDAPPAKKKPDEDNEKKKSSKKKSETADSKQEGQEEKPSVLELEKKASTEKTYAKLVGMIKAMTDDELPRRKTKDKVAVTCPADKKPGDSIMFENPHVKGQRLKVKIPKNTVPGGNFKVTVPVPADEDDDTDHNKWSREFYEVLSEYAYHYDGWMDAMTDRHVTAGREFPGHFKKREKFDKLLHEFPKDLKTTIDKAYLQKILRRARQNKHKRDKTAKRLEERAKELAAASSAAKPSSSEQQQQEEDDDETTAPQPPSTARVKSESVSSRDTTAAQPPKPKPAAPHHQQHPRAVKLPVFSATFAHRPFDVEDFA